MSQHAYRAELDAAHVRIAMLEAAAEACPRCRTRRRRWVFFGKVIVAVLIASAVAGVAVVVAVAIAFASMGPWVGTG